MQGKRNPGVTDVGLLAMQKVVGSSPISRLESPANRHFSRTGDRLRSTQKIQASIAVCRSLGKAPARRGVPAASSPRFARADEGFLELGDDWGTEPSAPQPLTQRPRARLRTRPHGSPSLPDVAPSDAHPPSLVRQLTLLVKACAGLALANPWRLLANKPTVTVRPPPGG